MRGNLSEQDLTDYALNELNDVDRLYVESMLAAYKLRAVPINVNFRYVEDELVYLLDNSDAVALVFQAQFAPLVAAIRPRLPGLRHLVVVDDGTPDPVEVGAVPYDEALAAASPEGFTPVARAQILPGVVRAYPAIASGLLYVRNEKTLVCLDLRK